MPDPRSQPTPGAATDHGRFRRTVELFAPRPSTIRHPLTVWPYTRQSLGWFVAAFVAMTAVWTVVGLAVVEWFAPSALGEAEEDLSLWLEDQRTDSLNTIADILSVPSDTFVKIALMAVLAIAFPLVFRRWHEWSFLLGALVLEVCVYGLSSYLVGRPRPPVERLTTAPTESFPSGHMAAAVTFYIGIAIVVTWNTTSKVWRSVAWTIGLLIPIGMFFSRLYLGMHYVSDMIGGIALGIVSLVVALNIARTGLDDRVEEIEVGDGDDVPREAERLDRAVR